MIRVLVVDDLQTVRILLTHLINSEPDMEVVGEASDGEDAVRKVLRFKPDLVTMDINMPVKSGTWAIRQIMAQQACPIIIVSDYWNGQDKNDVFEALQLGALGVVNKPKGIGHPQFERSRAQLIKTVRLLSEIKVVTRKNHPRKVHSTLPGKSISTDFTKTKVAPVDSSSMVLIGSSTGGPVVIKEILENIPKPFPLPILIVQHISSGFVEGLVAWLGKSTGHEISIAKHDELPLPGRVYFAPDGLHMGLRSSGAIFLKNDLPEFGVRPSVSYLFRSALLCHPEKTISILLTGMGSDGALELLELKSRGSITLIQERNSCVVFGMPGQAFQCNAHTYELTPLQIAEFLTKLETLNRINTQKS